MALPLTYASPESAASDPRRKLAAAHANGNGCGCVFIGAIILMSGYLVSLMDGHGGLAPSMGALLLAAEGVLFLTSGTLHVFCGYRLARPNRSNEHLLVITAGIHVALMLVFVIFLVYRIIIAPGPFAIFQVIALFCTAMIVMSLTWGVYKVRLLWLIP